MAKAEDRELFDEELVLLIMAVATLIMAVGVGYVVVFRWDLLEIEDLDEAPAKDLTLGIVRQKRQKKQKKKDVQGQRTFQRLKKDESWYGRWDDDDEIKEIASVASDTPFEVGAPLHSLGSAPWPLGPREKQQPSAPPQRRRPATLTAGVVAGRQQPFLRYLAREDQARCNRPDRLRFHRPDRHRDAQRRQGHPGRDWQGRQDHPGASHVLSAAAWAAMCAGCQAYRQLRASTCSGSKMSAARASTSNAPPTW